jgi:ornithine decarboxylase
MYTSRAIRNKNYVADILSVWKQYIPTITPYYSIKACPDPYLLEHLSKYDMTIGFEYVSKNELCLVEKYSNPVIFSNPVKHMTDIEYSRDAGKHTYIIDSIEEFIKIKECDAEANYIIRIQGYDSYSDIQFNSKFGANLAEFIQLLDRMWQEGHTKSFYGISYHIGSKCNNMVAHLITLQSIFEEYLPILQRYNIPLSMIDIGGGFYNVDQLRDIRRILNGMISYCNTHHIQLIAEPGRLFCSGYLDLLTDVISVRKRIRNGRDILYVTINDSIYHTFQGMIYDLQKCNPIVVGSKENEVECTIFGQTCDSMDVICENVWLPEPVVGDILLFENMGAYSVASSYGTFNGFESARVV